jgi:hypothetical protein
MAPPPIRDRDDHAKRLRVVSCTVAEMLERGSEAEWMGSRTAFVIDAKLIRGR